jgi:hypothetical protein
MLSYAAKHSFLCAMTLAVWFMMKDQTNADNVIAVGFFMVELGLLTVYLTYRAIRRMWRAVMWRATYDIKYWNGPTITFEGNDRKFLPILDEVGTWSQSRREKYGDTFSDEDAEMYWTTYSEEVAEYNEAQERERIRYIESGEAEADRQAMMYEREMYQARKAEKRANREAGFAASRQREANRQAQNALDRQQQNANRQAAIAANKARNQLPVRTQKPEKFTVQVRKPGHYGYQNLTGGDGNMANAERRMAQHQDARAGSDNLKGNASKARYRIVDKDGKVQ